MNTHRPAKKVTPKRGQRPSHSKRGLRPFVERNQRFRSKAEQALPDTSGIPWLGPRTKG